MFTLFEPNALAILANTPGLLSRLSTNCVAIGISFSPPLYPFL
jgi:hypothetical protein